MEIENTPEGVLLKRTKPGPPTRIEDVFGSMHRPGMKRVSIEEMTRVAKRYVGEKFARENGVGRVRKRRKP